MTPTLTHGIELKSEQDLGHMRRAGRLAAEILAAVGARVNPGVSTNDLNVWAEKMIREAGAVPTFLGYRGYGASLCVSLNDEVVHGVPHPKRLLREGDIVSLDIGVYYQGFVGDTALPPNRPIRVPARSVRLMPLSTVRPG